jgi:hypothetical protein
VNQGPIWGRLLKKTRGRQSRATVPLSAKSTLLHIWQATLEAKKGGDETIPPCATLYSLSAKCVELETAL